MVQKVPFKAVLFDLDGTLVNSSLDVAAALNHVFSVYGKSFDLEQIRTFLADGLDNMLSGLALLGDLSLTAAQLSQLKENYLSYYQQDPVRHTVIYPGVVECLKELRLQGIKLAICSNKPSVTARVVLKKLGLEQYFSCIIAGDDTPRKKPDPLHVRLVLDKIAISPEEAVMVGDSPPDIQAAHSMGVPAVLFTDGKSSPEALEPDACFQTFSCLIETLCSLRS